MRGCPTFVEDGYTHSVIYIEYINKIPHSVKTVSYIPNAVTLSIYEGRALKYQSLFTSES